MNKTIWVYASLSPEYLVERGEASGLTAQAIEMFRHFEEVPLRLIVDSDGIVRECLVDPSFLEAELR